LRVELQDALTQAKAQVDALTKQVEAQALELAELRGQMTAMLALGASDKSLEISEVVRKLKLARE